MEGCPSNPWVYSFNILAIVVIFPLKGLTGMRHFGVALVKLEELGSGLLRIRHVATLAVTTSC